MNGSRAQLVVLVAVPIVGLAIGERVVATSTTLAAALFGAVLIWLLLAPSMLCSGESRSVRDLSWALAIVPSIRLLSLTMPVDRIPPLLTWLVVAMLTVITVFTATKKLGYSYADIGLSWRWTQLVLASVGVAIGAAYGLLLYNTLRPRPLIGDLALSDAWLPSLALVYLVGVAEELLFRGLVQRASINAFGWLAGIALPALVFAALYADSPSLIPVVLALIAGCALGWLALAGRSIVAPVATRSAMVVTTFVVAPHVVPVATVPPPIPEPVTSSLLATPALHIPPVGGPQTRRQLPPAVEAPPPPPTATPPPGETPVAVERRPTALPTPLLAPRPIVTAQPPANSSGSPGGAR